jgi:hypothetical protein
MKLEVPDPVFTAEVTSRLLAPSEAKEAGLPAWTAMWTVEVKVGWVTIIESHYHDYAGDGRKSLVYEGWVWTYIQDEEEARLSTLNEFGTQLRELFTRENHSHDN